MPIVKFLLREGNGPHVVPCAARPIFRAIM
jgi:hypothetical protein